MSRESQKPLWPQIDVEIHNLAALGYRRSQDKYKRDHYTSAILNADGEQGAVFKIADKLFHTNKEPILPTYDSATQLANEFASFFIDKVNKIQAFMPPLSTYHHSDDSFPETKATTAL